MANKNQHCSFCGKPKEETRRLITGPDGACICDECVNTCSEIIEEYRRSGMPPIHHSDVYREAEHPAYRVVDSKLLRDYFENRNYKKDVSL